MDSPPVENLKKYDSRRVLARLVDALIVGVPSTLAAMKEDEGAYWIFVAFSLIYFFICEATLAQTIGKKMMGLRVMTRDGQAPSVNAVSVRTVLRLIDDGPLGLIVLVCSGERRQRIGDLLAGTTVGEAGLAAPRPKPNALLALYPTAWLIGALVFITLPSSAAADDYRRQAQEICRLVNGPEPPQWTPVIQQMYTRHAALVPPADLRAVHAALLHSDKLLLDSYATVEAGGDEQSVRAQLSTAVQERHTIVEPELPGCGTGG